MKPHPITPKFPRPLFTTGATPSQTARLETLAALEHRACLPVETTCHRPRHAAAARTHMGFLGFAADHGTQIDGRGRHGARAVAPSRADCLRWSLLDAGAMAFLWVAFVILWTWERIVRGLRACRIVR